jgi:hypothetical protein
LLRKNGKKNRQVWRSPNRLLLDPPLIYAEKRKSETDLQKNGQNYGRIAENQEKRKRYLLTCAITEKRNKEQKQTFNEF